MKQFSFRNRIAFYYIITTALLIAFVFFVIYISVSFSVYSHINDDINSESAKHLTEIEVKNGRFYLTHDKEWQEREHNTIDVNPVFIQFMDKNKQVVKKSPNLKKSSLAFSEKENFNQLFDAKLIGKSIRQIQSPIYEGKEIIGYLMVAMSLENTYMVLNDLLAVLIIAYPSILVILFLIARLIAGKSIKPISTIMATSNAITKDNLKSRIPLSKQKDELYVLSKTINNLLERLETAIEREKQFTSDASHELRTPLTVIKGTLEVLIRKPRTPEEYRDKIDFCVSEVDRLNYLVDQLLLLARYEDEKQSLRIESVCLNDVVLEVIAMQSLLIDTKEIKIQQAFQDNLYCETDKYLLSIIITNLISNAVKYSNDKSNIRLELKENENQIECVISDSGMGIPEDDLEKIFQPFFRSKLSNNNQVKGIGLGLSLVQRLCKLLEIEIKIDSKENKGTTVSLFFSTNKLKGILS